MADTNDTKDIEQNESGNRGSVNISKETPKYSLSPKEQYEKYGTTNPNVDAYTIDEDYFETPEMGDFFLGAVDCEYLERLDEILSGDDKDAQKAAYYTESPYITDCGTTDDGTATFIAATVDNCKEAVEGGWLTGDQIICKISSLSTDGNTMQDANNSLFQLKKDLKQGTNPYGTLTDDDHFVISLYGTDIGVVPKWVYETNVPEGLLEIKEVEYGKYCMDPDFVLNKPDNFISLKNTTIKDILDNFDKYKSANIATKEQLEAYSTLDQNDERVRAVIEKYADQFGKAKVKVAKICGKWREIVYTGNGSASFKWLLTTSQESDSAKSLEISKKMADILSKTGNKVYLMIDNTNTQQNSIFRQSSVIPEKYAADLKKMSGGSEHGKFNGYSLAMMEETGKLAGTVYVKLDKQWVNLAKALLAGINDLDKAKPNDEFSTQSPAFKKDYDPEKVCYADAFFQLNREIDDRRTIQNEIFGKEFDTLNKWTVTIGDVTLFIPPTNISIQSDVENNSQPLLRARGSMIKNSSRTVRHMQLNLYFSGNDGINGYRYDKAKHPNGEKTVYYMNGLRALISQFKFTPFLPIENEYINDTLGIDAVTMQAISINSIPNMPKLFQVQLFLNEFDYSTYMPELYIMCKENEWQGNVFSVGFNWPTFRYYYQRALQKGNEILSSGLEFNSAEYAKAALKNRTMLQPMRFESSNAEFYIADTDYLDKMLKKKMEADSGKSTRIKFTDEEKDAIKGASKFAESLASYFNSRSCQKKIEDINSGDFTLGFWDGTPTSDYLNHGTYADNLPEHAPTFEFLVAGLPTEDGDFEVDDKATAEKRNMLGTLLEEIRHETSAFIDKDARLNGSDYYLKSEVAEDGTASVEVGLTFKLSLSEFNDSKKLYDLKKAVNAYTYMQPDDFFNDGLITVPFIIIGDTKADELIPVGSSLYYDSNGNGLQISSNNPDMKFLAWCKERADEWNDEDLNAADNGDGTEDWRLNPTYASLANLKYNKYETGSFKIIDYNINMSNNFSHHYLQDIAGEVCQFLGGSDTHFSMKLLTEDKTCVSAFSQLNILTSSYIKKYRSVLPCFPLKMDSEFTRFIGVNEVMLTNVSVSTVDNNPGLYSISLELQSVDRTLRNREALAMIEGQNYGRSQSSVLTDADVPLKNIANYFHMEKVMSWAELYPDLELPTIAEMEEIGYKFVRYKFQDDRVYVDPDFYFLYLAKLSSQMLRDSIINADEAGLNGEMILEDASGAKVTIAAEKDNGFKVIDRNNIAQEQHDKIKAQADSQEMLKNKRLNENLKDDKKRRLEEQELMSWDISSDIKVKLMEETYKKEYDAYVAKIKSEIAQIKDGAVNTVDNGDGTKTQTKTVVNKDGTKTKTTSIIDKDGNTVKETKETIGEADKTASDRQVVQNKVDEEYNMQDDLLNWYKEHYGISYLVADKVFDLNSMMTKDKATEGKWVASELANARKAAVMIEEYLTESPIQTGLMKKSLMSMVTEFLSDSADLMIEADNFDTTSKEAIDNRMLKRELENPVNTYKDRFDILKDRGEDTTVVYAEMKEEIYAAVEEFLYQDKITAIFNLIPIELSAKFIEITKDIVYAAACSATGEKEYSNKQNALNWKPSPTFLGVVPGKKQDNTKKNEATTIEEAVDNAVEFSIFRIKAYDANTLKKTLRNMSYADPKKWTEEEKKEYPNITEYYLLDPYYSSEKTATIDLIREYKQNCISSPAYAVHAFMRLMLIWLQYMLDTQQLPSFNADLLRKAETMESEILKTMAKIGAQTVSDAKLKKALATFAENAYQLDSGKMWMSAIYTLTDGDNNLIKRVDNREYEALNSYVQSAVVPKRRISAKDSLNVSIRKMNMALAGLGRMQDFNADGVIQNNPAIEAARNYDEKKFVEAAEDPKMFIKHACHDMIVHDARGRMLRAFPTYYMLFIDEGREIGAYKLHDNFYNSMSIMEMEVVKSRKLPADTARIVISNFYNTLSTEDEDTIPYFNGSTVEAVASIFAFSSNLAQKAEENRVRKEVESRIRIRPGARIHLRMGYGSNASMLPVCFNGTIAECNASETVEIIAQGDGIELTNPIFEDVEAQKLVQDDYVLAGLGASIFSNGTTPAKIMRAIMTNTGGIINKSLKALGAPDLIGTSPYGLYHFGSPDMRFIHRMGEPCQNIYEAQAKQSWNEIWDIQWGHGGSGEFADDEAPSITFDIFGKTAWDIAHICKSVMPDFIVGVAPFDFRSTLFIGAPRYYYAYSYLNVNGAIHEKRKPYQQYHFYTSASDILANGIVATQRDMKTVAMGLYSSCATFNSKEQHKVGPLYADIDIYPEYQKTMIVDTQLLGKGTPIIGAMGGNFFTSFEFIDSMFDDKGEMVSHEKIAWKMTASALRESMMDMYAGDMVVLGDPSVKPHDRMCILDNYEHITGQCLVKEVVHHMSVDKGFITTISPDAIITVDDPYETTISSILCNKALSLAPLLTGAAAIKIYKAYKNDPNALSTAIKKGEEWLSKNHKNISNGLKKGAEEASKLWNKTEGARNVIKSTAKEVADKPAENVIKTFIKKGVTKGAQALAKSAIKAGGRMILGAVAGSAMVGAAVAAAPALALTIASFVAFEVIGSFVNNQIERFTKNLEVVHVYPLKRYGRTWTAGLVGSKGVISGSPTEKEQGTLQSFIGSVIGESPDSPFINFAKSLIFSDEAMATATKFRRDNGTIDENGKPRKGQGTFDAVLRASASNGSKRNRLQADYRQMQITPRADYTRGDDVLMAYNHYAMTNPKMYHNDSKMNYVRLISEENRIKPYIDERFFKIIHETPALNVGNFVDSQIINIKGEQKYVKVIQQKQEPSTANPDGLVFDMPLLNPDAMNILYEILRRTKNNMPAANASDPQEGYEETKNSFVLLESALRVGDTKSQAAAGFSFVLRGVEKAAQPLAAAIKALHEEIENDAKGNKLMNSVLFDSKDMGDNKTAITVRMPKITGKNSDKEAILPQPKDTRTVDINSEKVNLSNKRDYATPDSALNVPEYSGEAYYDLNGGKPSFDNGEKLSGTYKQFSPLDDYGRCGAAEAVITANSMPDKFDERGDISMIYPSGYINQRYDEIGGYLYNRSHLIGYSLSGENANALNLVTGTDYMNKTGMTSVEEQIKAYINTHPDGSVRYRVTPIYKGKELVPRGVLMEAQSSDGVLNINRYCYNVQPGIEIDYATGESKVAGK